MAQGPGAKSRAVNANHEMYSGGEGYHGKVLPAFQQPLIAENARAAARWELAADPAASATARIPSVQRALPGTVWTTWTGWPGASERA